jgi:hypothetical protein
VIGDSPGKSLSSAGLFPYFVQESSVSKSIAVGFSLLYVLMIYWLINCRWLQPTVRRAVVLNGL